MKLLSLGNNVFKLVQETPAASEKAEFKKPANTRSVTFMKQGDVIRVIRGNLFISNKEIERYL